MSLVSAYAPTVRRVLLVAAIAAGTGTAVGLWATHGGERSRTTTTVGTLGVPAPDSGEIVVPYSQPGMADRPLARRLAVFRRPARPSDRWPDSFLAGAAQDEFYYEDGVMLLDRSRRVLAGPVSVFAVPSRQGSVCYMTSLDEPDCVEELSRGHSFEFMTIGKRVAVFGLLGDGVTVAAAAGGRRLRVHLGENAYLVVLPRRFPGRGRLAFRRADGTDVLVLAPERHPSISIVVGPASTSGAGR